MTGAWVYIVKCSDGSYYTGLTRNELPEAREQQHNAGVHPDAYTYNKRPVKLVYAEYLELVVDAIEAERKIKKMVACEKGGPDCWRLGACSGVSKTAWW